MKKGWLLFVTGAIALSLLGGCQGGGGDDGFKPDPNAGKTTAQRTDEQIKAIESNPNMPESAKQMAIATYKAHANGGAGHP